MNEEQLFQQYSTDRALQARYPDFESYKQAVISVGRNQNVFQTLAERGREYLQNVPEYLSGAGQELLEDYLICMVVSKKNLVFFLHL